MLERITSKNCTPYDTLVQDYEEEFAPITGKVKGADGKYPLDSTWKDPYEGYYWTDEGKQIGFVIIKKMEKVSDVAEFYVIPSCRKKGIGFAMAKAVFNKYPGSWQVKQIEGVDHAKAFWRRVVDRCTSGNYDETIEDDPYWGIVTCQKFST